MGGFAHGLASETGESALALLISADILSLQKGETDEPPSLFSWRDVGSIAHIAFPGLWFSRSELKHMFCGITGRYYSGP
jgi:hypothetical protein